MWVRIPEWMLAENEPPRPRRNAVLHSVGIRMLGMVSVETAAADGVVELSAMDTSDPQPGRYALTGIASEANDVWTAAGRWWQSRRQAGAEFMLTVGANRFHVQFDGQSSEVKGGSRHTAVGELVLIGKYEWRSFELTDTRADWLVTRVVDLPGGDIHVALEPSPHP